jgi:hypothetical protein
MEGRKNDQGKLRWDLLPLDVMEPLVEIYEFGANKYGENNWRTIKDGYRRCRAAFFRHLTAYDKGELTDPESGKSHLAHCAWNALSMMYFETNGDITNPIAININEEATIPCVAPYRGFIQGEMLCINMGDSHFVTQNYWHAPVYDKREKEFSPWSAWGFREENELNPMTIYPATDIESELYFTALAKRYRK